MKLARECIGGPLDGRRFVLGGRRMVVAFWWEEDKDYSFRMVDDEAGLRPEYRATATGRYVCFPKDRRPDALRWIPYDSVGGPA